MAMFLAEDIPQKQWEKGAEESEAGTDDRGTEGSDLFWEETETHRERRSQSSLPLLIYTMNCGVKLSP